MTTRQDFQVKVIEAVPSKALVRMSEDQWDFLRTLCDRRGWSAGCGWTWDNPSTTARLGDSLVKRGLATKFDHGRWGRFKAVDTIQKLYDETQLGYEAKRYAQRQAEERERAIYDRQRSAERYATAELIRLHRRQYDSLCQEYRLSHPLPPAPETTPSGETPTTNDPSPNP